MHSKDTVEFLRSILDEAWISLTPRQKMSIRRSDMAAFILEAADELMQLCGHTAQLAGGLL